MPRVKCPSANELQRLYLGGLAEDEVQAWNSTSCTAASAWRGWTLSWAGRKPYPACSVGSRPPTPSVIAPPSWP